MSEASGVAGICSREQPLAEAAEQLRRRGYRNLQTFSPIPSEKLISEEFNGESEEGPGREQSPVRAYTLAGGILGFISGLALTIWTSLDWPLRTGGKQIVSIPPYLIIAFELTILFGGLFTLAGLLIHARLLRRAPVDGYDARFSVDRFGVFVPCGSGQVEEVKQLFHAAGVEETSVETA